MGPQDGIFIVVLFLAIATLSPVKCLTSTFTAEEKRQFLWMHNQLRETASPRASKMNFITWNYKLEALAIIAAKKCNGEHNYGAEYKGLGENIYSGANFDPVRISTLWFTEKNTYNHETGGCPGGKMCGHYTQVMSDTTKEMGCGHDPSCKHVYCEYSTGAGSFTYGPPCSACPPDRPLCLNGLCASSEIVEAYAGPTVTVATGVCKIACNTTYCGKRDSTSGNCKCNCEPETKGRFCEQLIDKTANFTKKCSACTDSPACLNGGTEDTSDQEKCKCICKPAFVGERCETAKAAFDNSVRLSIRTGAMLTIGPYSAYPPISRSVFAEKIWPIMQAELVKLIDSFCKTDAAKFAQCCPGKTFPGAAAVASKSHVKVEDVKLIESSVGNPFEGSLNFLVYAMNAGNTLCADGATTSYVLQSVLKSATEPNKDKIKTALLNKVRAAGLCCYDVIELLEVTNAVVADLAFGIQDVPLVVVNYTTVKLSIPDENLTVYDFSSKSSEYIRTIPTSILLLSVSLSLWLHLLVI